MAGLRSRIPDRFGVVFTLALFLFIHSIAVGMNPGFPSLPTESQEPKELVIHNRILAKVGDKTISVLDIVKQMDVFIHTHYPHIENSLFERFQFYTTNWREVLQQTIDIEMIIADAGDKDLNIADSEIREGVLERFGPNVMLTLDQCGISYEEAQKIVRDDLVVQRMNWFKVHAKTLQKIGPKELREAYQNYLSSHPQEEEWTYQVLSIKSPEEDLSKNIAKEAFSLLHTAHVGMESLAQKLGEEKQLQKDAFSFSISNELTATEKTISLAHRLGLEGLHVGEYSAPIPQQSGNDSRPVQRIFWLKNHTIKQPPSFYQLKETLEQELIHRMIQKENIVYKERLNKKFQHFFMLEPFGPNFEPFSLRFN